MAEKAENGRRSKSMRWFSYEIKNRRELSEARDDVERVMGILLQKMRLELALRAAFSRLLTKAGEAAFISSA